MLNKEQCAAAINVAMMLEQVGYKGPEFDFIFGLFRKNDPQLREDVLQLYLETSDCTRRLYFAIMMNLPSVSDEPISYKL